MHSIIAAFLCICLSPALAGQAGAAATDWSSLGGGKARLLAVLDPVTNKVEGVVEFLLDKGWKTYWREPGASGVPPQFDFSGSRHFRAGEVLFPVPEHIKLEGAEFAGYRNRVLFPFTGETAGEAGSGSIELSLFAGVCEEICIPASANFALPLAQLMLSDPVALRTIGEAKLALPAAPDDTMHVGNAAIGTGGDLVVTATVRSFGGEPALFAEGPAGWRFVPARLKSQSGPIATFHLDLTGAPAGMDAIRLEIRFTLVQDGRGIEQSVTVGR